METAWEFYGPWLTLAAWAGVPLLLVGTVTVLLFERGSFSRWAAGRVTLIGWALVLVAVAGYGLLRVLESAFSNLPGT